MEPAQPGDLPGGRWLFASVFVHALAEFSAWITVLVVAFDRGGPSGAALAVTTQLVPAALLAPIVGAAGDRFPRQRVVAASFVVQAAAGAGIAVALVADAPLIVVYSLAAMFTVATIATPAAIASLLVHHARTPTQLTRWNVTRSFTRAAGSLIGPLLTALLLALTSPAVVFAVLAAGCMATGVLVGLRLPDDDRLPSVVSIRSVLDDARHGIGYVASTPTPRGIVLYIGVAEMLIGALDLVFVGVAFDQLGRGGSTVALLSVAFAVGALLAVSIVSRAANQRLSRLVVLGAALLTLPLLFVGETTLLVVVLAVTALLGAGNGLIEIGTQTLLQRSCAETMTSRAYGALDSTTLIAAAIGAAIAGRLIAARDLTEILVGMGAVGAVVLIAGGWRLRSTERALRPTDPRLVACLRSVAFLASLPQPTLERLARVSRRRMVPSGRPVVVQGEPGTEFFVLIAGELEVWVDDGLVARLTAPASFGEVALLRTDERTATVTAAQPCELAVIRRDDFIDAVSRTATSHRGALAAAQQYGPPAERE